MTTQLQQQQMQPMTGRPMDERITSLEVRVGGIEDGIKHIVNKLDQKDRTPWGMLIGAAGFMVTIIGSIGGLAFSPLSSGIADVKAAIVKFEGKTESYMKREDIEAQITGVRVAFDDRFKVSAERRNDLQVRSDDRMARIERDVDALQKAVVPRGEHEQTWAGQRMKDDALQRQLDQARADLNGLNTPRDTIQGMQRRIDELERDARAPARR